MVNFAVAFEKFGGVRQESYTILRPKNNQPNCIKRRGFLYLLFTQ